MSLPPLAYAHFVGDRNPLHLMGETPTKYSALVSGWDSSIFSGSYAPGKWTAAQILVHMAQIELASGNRVRLALSTRSYVVQPWDADAWMANESRTDPITALETYLALRRFNLALYETIRPEQQQKVFAHPELIAVSIDWILNTIAGHDLHHLRHLTTIADSK